MKCLARGSGWRCDRDAEIAGRCPAHYQQLRRGGPERPIRDEVGVRISGIRVADRAYRALAYEARRLGIGIATLARRILEDWAGRERQ